MRERERQLQLELAEERVRSPDAAAAVASSDDDGVGIGDIIPAVQPRGVLSATTSGASSPAHARVVAPAVPSTGSISRPAGGSLSSDDSDEGLMARIDELQKRSGAAMGPAFTGAGQANTATATAASSGSSISLRLATGARGTRETELDDDLPSSDVDSAPSSAYAAPVRFQICLHLMLVIV